MSEDNIDLVGLDTRRRRSQTTVTVLTRTDERDWSTIEIHQIERLLTRNCYERHPQHPGVIITDAVLTERQVASALGTSRGYTVETFTGYDHPTLPWQPSLF